MNDNNKLNIMFRKTVTVLIASPPLRPIYPSQMISLLTNPRAVGVGAVAVGEYRVPNAGGPHVLSGLVLYIWLAG